MNTSYRRGSMAGTQSAAQRREQTAGKIVMPTGVDAALTRRLARPRRASLRQDAHLGAVFEARSAHFGEGGQRVAESVDLGIAGQHGVLVAQDEAFRDHKLDRRLDHHDGDPQ